MKINFEQDERQVIWGFLFQTRYSVKTELNYNEANFKNGTIDENTYTKAKNHLQRQLDRVNTLVNKFTGSGNFVKIKHNDAIELKNILEYVVTDADAKKDAEIPPLTEKDYNTCIQTLERLTVNIQRCKYE